MKPLPMKSAVLVIDVQQDLCEGEGAPFDCPATVQRINQVTHQMRLAKGLDVQSSDLKVRKTTPDAFLRTNLDVGTSAAPRCVINCY